MTETIVSHPAAPADGSTYGGFAEIARRLSALHPERHPFSRQLVAKWYAYRGVNDFPERMPVEVNGKTKLLFDLEAVERWHAWWLAKRHPERRPIETIPLFSVDHRGHPTVPAVHPVDREQDSYRGHPNVRENYRDSVLDL
jgi:hypothetical protein